MVRRIFPGWRQAPRGTWAWGRWRSWGNGRFQDAQRGGVGAVTRVRGHRGRSGSGEEAGLRLRQFERSERLAHHPGAHRPSFPVLQTLKTLLLPAKDGRAPLPSPTAKARQNGQCGMGTEVKKALVRGSSDHAGTPAGGVAASEGSLCLREPQGSHRTQAHTLSPPSPEGVCLPWHVSLQAYAPGPTGRDAPSRS